MAGFWSDLLLRSRERRLWPGLLLGFAGLGFALLLSQILAAGGSGDRFYVLMVLPVIAAAWVSGISAGLICTALGAVLMETVHPYGLRQDPIDSLDLLPTITFVLTGGLTALFAARAREAALDAERARRDLSRQHAIVLEQLNETVVVFDLQGRMVSMNRAARSFYGPNVGRIETMSLDQRTYITRFDGSPLPPDQNPVARALRGERVQSTRLKMNVEGVGPRFISASASPLHNASDQIVGAVFSFRDVTEIVERERSIYDKQAFLQSVLDTVDESICACDTDERLTLFNRAAEETLGPLQDLPPEKWSGAFGVFYPDGETHVHPNDLPLMRALRGENVQNVPMLIKRPKQPMQWISWSGRRYYDTEGNVLGATISGRDITADLAAKEELNRRRLFLQTVMDTIDEFIIVSDTEGNPTLFNKSAERLLGPLKPTTLATRSATYGAFEETGERPLVADQSPLMRTVRGEQVVNQPVVIRRGESERFTVWTGRQIRDESGEILGAVVSGRDLTEFKAAEREREMIFELSDDLLTEASFDGKWTRLNPAWKREMGWEHDQLIGEPIWSIIHPEDMTRTTAKFEEILVGGKAVNFTIRVQHGNGTWRWLSWNTVPDLPGKRLLAVARDVTSNVEQQEQLEVTLGELRRSNAELENFAYVASHDLQEPLRKIRAFGDRLAAKLDSVTDEAALDYLQRMQTAAGRMSTLIQDLLSFSRVNTRNTTPSPVNLAEIADGVLDDLQELIATSNALVDVQSGLPTITGNDTQLRQLFQNLLSNALKFARPEVRPEVQIRWSQVTIDDKPMLELRFLDNGVGIEPQHREKIFAIFQRLHGRSAYSGTGIGLAVVRKIAEIHGGSVHVDDLPSEHSADMGSCFVVRLAMD